MREEELKVLKEFEELGFHLNNKKSKEKHWFLEKSHMYCNEELEINKGVFRKKCNTELQYGEAEWIDLKEFYAITHLFKVWGVKKC